MELTKLIAKPILPDKPLQLGRIVYQRPSSLITAYTDRDTAGNAIARPSRLIRHAQQPCALGEIETSTRIQISRCELPP
jgi:hypothetical protein